MRSCDDTDSCTSLGMKYKNLPGIYIFFSLSVPFKNIRASSNDSLRILSVVNLYTGFVFCLCC